MQPGHVPPSFVFVCVCVCFLEGRGLIYIRVVATRDSGEVGGAAFVVVLSWTVLEFCVPVSLAWPERKLYYHRISPVVFVGQAGIWFLSLSLSLSLSLVDLSFGVCCTVTVMMTLMNDWF